MADEVKKLRLKILIDRKKHRVLFAEAEKPVVDFLFSLLCLPLATVVKLLNGQDFSSCVKNLYCSVQELKDIYLQVPNQTKDGLLNPKPNIGRSLNPLSLPEETLSSSRPGQKFYSCSLNRYLECRNYVTGDPKVSCRGCRLSMSREIEYLYYGSGSGGEKDREEGRGYVNEMITFMVMDDLSVKALSAIDIITLLNDFNVHDLQSLEKEDVDFDVDKGLKLIQASLESKTVLTDVFLGPKCVGKEEEGNGEEPAESNDVNFDGIKIYGIRSPSLVNNRL